MRMFAGKGVVIVFVATLALGVCGLTSATEVPNEVTYTKDVLPVLQENCQECHRSFGSNLGGMVAPMSFMSYRETRPWASRWPKPLPTAPCLPGTLRPNMRAYSRANAY